MTSTLKSKATLSKCIIAGGMVKSIRRERRKTFCWRRNPARLGINAFLTPFLTNARSLLWGRSSGGSTVASDASTTSSQKDSRLADPTRRVSYQKPLQYSERESTAYQLFSRVRFGANVSVVEIPSHRDYSCEDCERLWTKHSVTSRNKKKSKREFRADGSNWRTCTEEDGMLVVGGELVHPYTWLCSTGRTEQCIEEYYRSLVVNKNRELEREVLRRCAVMAVLVMMFSVWR